MIIKHYNEKGDLRLIENAKNVSVFHKSEKKEHDSHSPHDFLIYKDEDIEKTQKIIIFDDEHGPVVMRAVNGTVIYICNNDGKTIETVRG